MSGSDSALEGIASAVADRTPVSWREALAARPDLAESVEALRAVERIATAMSSIHLSPGDSPSLRQAPPDSEQTRAHPGSLAWPGADLAGAGTWGPLRLLEKLGEGGFGIVYRAFDPSLRVEVALKLLLVDTGGGPDGLEFLAEARRLARVRHPNVLTVHGVAVHDGRAGMWSDLLRGQTLEELLATQGPFGAQEASLIGRDLCRAIAAVHAAGLVHRDVSTRNVLREHGGRIVLLDLGAGAEALAGGEGDPSAPVTGTPMMMAPELLRGTPASQSTDLYSLGVLLFRLVTRRYPVEATTIGELLERHARRQCLALRDLRPDLPEGFVATVERALEQDPMKRFASAGEMERALLNAGRTGELPPEWLGPSRQRRRRLLAGVAAGVGAVAALAFFVVRPWLEPRERTDGQGRSESGPAASPATSGGTDGTLRGGGAPGVEPPAAVHGALIAHAALFRETGAGEAIRLSDGAVVAPGDDLFLELTTSDTMHVYVLNEDRAGAAFVLFPVSGLDTRNPLPPGAIHRLPGKLSGRLMNWTVSSVGGRESIIVIGSRRPVPDVERDISRFPSASQQRPVSYGELNSTTLVALRGIGGLSPSPSSTRPTGVSLLSQALRDLPEAGAADRGVWTWVIELENAEP